jgi:glycosyltransferase involved in cell wall biosynthesis
MESLSNQSNNYMKRYAVFIPCYNASLTIGETIRSVEKAIEATGRKIPVYIYDDCSTDNAYKVAIQETLELTHFNVQRNPGNFGERKTTNLAFKKMLGQYDWAVIIHADDIVKEDWLVTLMQKTETVNDDKCFTVWSSYDVFHNNQTDIETGDNSGAVQEVVRSKEDIRYFITKVSSSWHISGAAINVQLYDRLHGFDERMPQFGDTDFFVKGLLAGYTDVYISRTLTFYRIVEGSVTSTSFRTNRDIREIYMLIDRYKNMLSRQEILRMYASVRTISMRRMIKWLIRLKPALAWMNFKQFSTALVQSTGITFKNLQAKQ